jgi:WD40 repeat protein
VVYCNDREMSIITTLENQCRALTSTSSPDEDASRFLVGTLSPNGNNLLYMFEYKDDNNNLAKVSFRFPFGEVWHLSSSSRQSNLVAGVLGNGNKLSVGLFRLPYDLVNSSIEDDYGLSESPIEQVVAFDHNGSKNLLRQSRWHPDDGYQLLTCSDGILNFWDIEQQKKARTFSLASAADRHANTNISEITTKSMKASEVTDLRWSSLFDCSVVAAAVGPKIYGIDTRISESNPASICWLIEDQRCVRVRSIDFNPNSQYYIASGGDDCRANFWDLRQTSRPALHLQAHTHWIWSIRYNPFHDQLVLTSGSDARVALVRAQSVASDPYGQIDMEDNDQSSTESGHEDTESKDESPSNDSSLNKSRGADNDKAGLNFESAEEKKEKKQASDGIIHVYQEHDDSVYAAEWATDPWIFASLGLESRFVISRVPKEEKFSILF